MTIVQEYGKYLLCCDHCLETKATLNGFDETIAYMKSSGWKSKKVYGEWVNICPSCQSVGE